MSVSTEQKRKEGGLAETLRVIFHALIIALVIRTFLFQPFNIPSGSMKATLLIGDYLFVSKYSYGYSHYSLPFSPPCSPAASWAAEPKRGDVVVFRLPKDNSTDYIKRVIGLPGDKIQMVGGVLHINGEAVKRERMEHFIDDEGGRPTRVRRWRETLAERRELHDARHGGQRFLRQHAGLRRAGRTLLHDGRQPRQLDRQPGARQVGYVPFQNIVGRAEIIFFSIGDGERALDVWRWPWAVRWTRLFTIVR